MSDPTGQLVEFIDKNRMILALVQGAKKTRLSLLTAKDKQLALPLGRVLFMSPAGISTDKPRSAQADYLARKDAQREELSAQVEVEELWELVHTEDDTLPLTDLAELVFGANFEHDHQAAVLRALFYERLHFKLSGGEYLPLSAEQLEKKRVQRQREADHRTQVDQAVAYLGSIDQDGQSPLPEPQGLIDLLRELVIFEEEAPRAKLAKEIVSLAELGGAQKTF